MRSGENSVLFGDFTLDRARGCLYRNGQRVRLTPRPFETLAFLLEHRGETIEKQQLINAVWKDSAVTDGALVQAIREVRRALEDDDKEPRYIQTVPRFGYRFIADVADEAPHGLPREPIPGPDRPASSRVWPWPAAAAILVGCLAVWLGRDGGIRIQSRAAPPETPEGGQLVRQLTSGPINAVKPQYSPDGQSLLYLSHDPEAVGLDLFVVAASGGEARQLTKGVNATGDLPVFTADGSRIVFSRIRSGDDGTRLRDLWAIPSSGGTPSLLLAEASGAGFSPDGTSIAYTKYLAGRKALWVGRIGDPPSHRELAARGFVPRWSPDGRWIAYTTSDPDGGAGHLWLVPATTGQPVRLTAVAEDMYGLAWAQNSQTVFVASERQGEGFQIRRVPISGGPASHVTAGVGHYLAPTVSPYGRIIAFCHSSPFAALVVRDSVTDREGRLLGASEYHLGHLWPRFSPSGRRIASVVRLHEGERLWVTDADTGVRLRASDRLSGHPAWLDDRRVAYLSPAEGPTERTAAYVMDVESGATSRWFEISGKATWLAVRPGANTVAFVSQSSPESEEVVVRDLRAGSTRVVASGAQYEALRWRPDGSMLAWSGPAEGSNVASNGIWLVEPDRDSPRQIASDGFSPAWSPDGAAVYFVRLRGRSENVGLWRYDLSSGAAVKVRSSSGVQYFYYDVAGNRFVVSSNETRSQIFDMRLPS